MRRFLAVLRSFFHSSLLCIFPATLLHQLFFHPLSPHLAIYFLVYLSVLLLPNGLDLEKEYVCILLYLITYSVQLLEYIYIYIYIYSFTYLLMVTCLNARKVDNFKPVAKYKMLHSRHNPTGVSKDLLNLMCGPGSSVGIATDYGLDGPGIEYRWGRDFTPVQAGPGVHPASYKVGTGSFPGVKCGRGVLLTTHPLLVPRPWKSRAIPLPTLWATPGL